MNKREGREQSSLPPCPNPMCTQPHVVRNGSHRGRQRYLCCTCKTYFGETQGTPMYGLKTPASEVAQALLVVMRRGSLRAAEEITGHKYETIGVWLQRAAEHAEALTEVLASDLHLSQHAFAKRDATWDALVGLQIFDHNFHRAHLALRQPLRVPDGVHRYQQRSPAMVLGLTDHL